ncbi:TIGR03013 family XrtA/PEP-CTERM system glycosyltransferase [Dokdonella sp.]|uniref:TIGR03013 family XrtA/PEP-CTERM system glycosyltransferase n=1 Tax=Dokdonella sp. TaxID=2291710 RepID=UPI0025C62D7A|nr:TIGR03013 family XrtA/PEP-CTERM system glycosyltransferase [Dokdonella sp.]
MREQGARWMLVLAVFELLVLIVSLMVAARLRFMHSAADLAAFSVGLELRATIFGLIIVTAMAAVGLYLPNLRENRLGMLVRQIMGFAAGGVAVVFVFYMIPQLFIGRGVILLALLISFPLVVLGRSIYLRLIDLKALRRRILVLGAGRRAQMINDNMRRRVDRRGFIVIGYVPLPGETTVIAADHLLPCPESLDLVIRQLQVNEIVVAADDRRGQLPMHQLLECKQMGVTVTTLVSFFERELGKVKLNLIDPSWLVFSDGFDATPLRRLGKILFDSAATFTVLALTWPLMLVTALAIIIESGPGAPILYRQERVGEKGRIFKLIKFRSMRTDAEADGVARWASKSDDRVTRVGRFIRKVRIDELPQLWNVMRGDMSLIGPRPERPQFVEELAKKIDYYELRHCVKPGLAGWAQLNYPYGADEKDAAEKLKYDLFYVKNHNFMLDLVILVQTVEVVLFRRGAR